MDSICEIFGVAAPETGEAKLLFFTGFFLNLKPPPIRLPDSVKAARHHIMPVKGQMTSSQTRSREDGLVWAHPRFSAQSILHFEPDTVDKPFDNDPQTEFFNPKHTRWSHHPYFWPWETVRKIHLPLYSSKLAHEIDI